MSDEELLHVKIAANLDRQLCFTREQFEVLGRVLYDCTDPTEPLARADLVGYLDTAIGMWRRQRDGALDALGLHDIPAHPGEPSQVWIPQAYIDVLQCLRLAVTGQLLPDPAERPVVGG
jgi:hypothetical protein